MRLPFLLTLAFVGLALGYPVERMAQFQTAPRVLVVCGDPALQASADSFARRFAKRRGLPVDVVGSAPAQSLPTIVLEVVNAASGRDRPTVTLGEARIVIAGTVTQLTAKLDAITGPPLASGGIWLERAFTDEDGSITVKHRSGSLVASELQEFVAARRADRDRIAAAIGLDPKHSAQLRYVLYETYEEKGLSTGSLLDAHLSSDDGSIHLVHGWDARGDDGRALARLLLERLGGAPGSRWVESGLPLALAQTPAPHDAFTRASRLASVDELATVPQLLDTNFWSRTSHRIVEPAAAALAREALVEITPAQVRNLWRLSSAPGLDLGDLHKRAGARLLADQGSVAASNAKTRRAALAFESGSHRGFCFAHEGYRIHNGYIGSSSAASLDELAEQGCNWISITPFLGFASTTSPQIGSVNRLSSRPGSETDEHVIQASVYARRRGMRVLLKPHLWSHAGWCGDLAMQSEADWRRFFRNYGDFVMHYALIAAEHEIPALAVGNELPGTTLRREADWRGLIARVRKVYPGKIIYCANWDREFEQLRFWDVLDACAVSCYFPLSQGAAPSEDELRDGARNIVARLAAVARRTGKPVLLTELGYAPMEGAWQAPYKESGGGFSPQAQERCFRAMLGALESADWCLGVYVWKWPSYLDHADSKHRGFSPRGKPALGVIRRFFDGR